MADTLSFQLVSPERLVLARDAAMVVVPGAEGDFGVLPEHAPIISSVRPGVIEVYEGNQVADRVFVAGGFAEVSANHCIVLAEEAVPVGDLDRAAVEARIKAAEQAVEDARTETDRSRAETEVVVARAMLEFVGS
tara:strand:- start:391 stop:795 length:405 start_codon:yes stop_codon:yes gene_type:complete